MHMMYIGMMNIYYLVLYNAATIQGDIFTTGILFGLAEFMGIMFGEPVMRKMEDYISLIISCSAIMVTSVIVKMPLSQELLYLTFLIQVFFCGLGFNVLFCVLESKTNPKLLASAYEINLCIAAGSTMIIPVVAKMPHPIPTTYICMSGLLIISFVVQIGPRKKKVEPFLNMEMSVLSVIKDINESQSQNSFAGFKGNLSSVIMDNNFLKQKIGQKWHVGEESSDQEDNGNNKK
jgi:hypothetical protein